MKAVISVLVVFATILLNARLIHADFTLTTPDGRAVLLKDDGTWRYVERKKPGNDNEYMEISLIDFQLDFKNLPGRKVKVSGIAQYFADMFMLKKELMDFNPIGVDISKVNRTGRQYALTNCSNGCRVTVYGIVGDGTLLNHIIATKLEW